MNNSIEKLRELVEEGKLKLWLQPSAPRTGSNFLSKMIYQSANIDQVCTFTMLSKYDDDEAYAKGLVQAYHELVEQKAAKGDKSAVKLFLKEHSRFIGPKIWELLKDQTEGIAFIVRDPILQSMSELNSLTGDPEYMQQALKKRGIDVGDIHQYLEGYAKEKGFSEGGGKSAFKNLTAHVNKTGEYHLVDSLLDKCYGSPGGRPEDFETARKYRAANVFDVSADSYTRMAELMKEADPDKSIVINATTIQGNPKSAHILCGRLNIPFRQQITEGKWVATNDTYHITGQEEKREAWGKSAKGEDSIVPPYKDTIDPDALPTVSKMLLEEKFRAYLILLNSELSSGPQTKEHFESFFTKEMHLEKAGVVIKGPLLEKNSVTCYAMVAASRTLPEADRKELQTQIKQQCPKFSGVFEEIDRIAQDLGSELVREDKSRLVYFDGTLRTMP